MHNNRPESQSEAGQWARVWAEKQDNLFESGYPGSRLRRIVKSSYLDGDIFKVIIVFFPQGEDVKHNGEAEFMIPRKSELTVDIQRHKELVLRVSLRARLRRVVSALFHTITNSANSMRYLGFHRIPGVAGKVLTIALAAVLSSLITANWDLIDNAFTVNSKELVPPEVQIAKQFDPGKPSVYQFSKGLAIFPEDMMSQPTKITIVDDELGVELPLGIQATNIVISVTLEDESGKKVQPENPFTLFINANEEIKSLAEGDDTKVGVWHYDEEKSRWEELNSAADFETREIVATVYKTSQIAVVIDNRSESAPAPKSVSQDTETASVIKESLGRSIIQAWEFDEGLNPWADIEGSPIRGYANYSSSIETGEYSNGENVILFHLPFNAVREIDVITDLPTMDTSTCLNLRLLTRAHSDNRIPISLSVGFEALGSGISDTWDFEIQSGLTSGWLDIPIDQRLSGETTKISLKATANGDQIYEILELFRAEISSCETSEVGGQKLQTAELQD